MLSHGAKYSDFNLGMFCTLRPHGVEERVSGKDRKSSLGKSKVTFGKITADSEGIV